MMHKAINGTLPESLKKHLTVENPFFFFKNSRIKQTQKSICYAGPKAWHNFPSDYIEELDFCKFKTRLRDDILNRNSS